MASSATLFQGKFTTIKDCAKIADNTVIPPNTVIPALSLFAGSPGQFDFFRCYLQFSPTIRKVHRGFTRIDPGNGRGTDKVPLYTFSGF